MLVATSKDNLVATQWKWWITNKVSVLDGFSEGFSNQAPFTAWAGLPIICSNSPDKDHHNREVLARKIHRLQNITLWLVSVRNEHFAALSSFFFIFFLLLEHTLYSW